MAEIEWTPYIPTWDPNQAANIAVENIWGQALPNVGYAPPEEPNPYQAANAPIPPPAEMAKSWNMGGLEGGDPTVSDPGLSAGAKGGSVSGVIMPGDPNYNPDSTPRPITPTPPPPPQIQTSPPASPPDPNQRRREWNTAITYFIERGQYDKAQEMLKMSADEVNEVVDEILLEFYREASTPSLWEQLHPAGGGGYADPNEIGQAAEYFASRGDATRADYLTNTYKPDAKAEDWNQDPTARAFLNEFRKKQGTRTLAEEQNPYMDLDGEVSQQDVVDASRFYTQKGDLEKADYLRKNDRVNNPILRGYVSGAKRGQQSRPFYEVLEQSRAGIFADGGVVQGPTLGILGEAGYPEAVVPLGNSPRALAARQRLQSQGVPTFANGGIVNPFMKQDALGAIDFYTREGNTQLATWLYDNADFDEKTGEMVWNPAKAADFYKAADAISGYRNTTRKREATGFNVPSVTREQRNPFYSPNFQRTTRKSEVSY